MKACDKRVILGGTHFVHMKTCPSMWKEVIGITQGKYCDTQGAVECSIVKLAVHGPKKNVQ